MAPSYLLVPLVILATAATVIASQALLSAAFSVTKQAIQLGYLPRMLIRHTSVHETGQVYVPAVNWILFATIVVAVSKYSCRCGSRPAAISAPGNRVASVEMPNAAVVPTTTSVLMFVVACLMPDHAAT